MTYTYIDRDLIVFIFPPMQYILSKHILFLCAKFLPLFIHHFKDSKTYILYIALHNT